MFVKEKCLYLGKITRSHGIHGQLVLASSIPLHTLNIEEPFLVDIDGGLVPFYLQKKEGLRHRDHQSCLIHFDHVSSKEEAEIYCECDIYLQNPPEITDTTETPNPNLFKGFTIYSENKKPIGSIIDIMDYSGNTLVSVMANNNELLLPFTKDHILDWDLANKNIILKIADGLLDF